MLGGGVSAAGFTPNTMSAASFCTPTPGGPCFTQPASSSAASPAAASRETLRLRHRSTVVLLLRTGGGALGTGRLAEERGQLGGVGVTQRQAGDHADGPDRGRVGLGQAAAQGSR